MRKKTLIAVLLCTLMLVGCGDSESTEGPVVVSGENLQEVLQEESLAEEEPEFRVITEREVVDGKMQSYLTGEWKDADVAQRRSMAVMMPNNSPALPQRGISYASIVYEAPVEGRMTRLMAIIEDYDDLEYVGPIRSSRDYYVYEAMAYDSIYCNWGLAVPYVADLINSDRVDNVSQAVSGIESSATYAFEYKDRPGYSKEFRGYMTIEGYEKAVEKKEYEPLYRDTFEQAFTFADEGCVATYEDYPDATVIWPGGEDDNRSGYGDANPCFTYNEEDGLYYRTQYGEEHIDEINGEQVAVSNVVFKLCHGEVRDDHDYLAFGVHGTGEAYVFTNGKVIEGTWERSSDTAANMFYDENGNEIIFNQGKTWICNIWLEYKEHMKWE